MKPRVHLHQVQTQRSILTPVDRARLRHGKPFAHEQGSDFKPHEIPVLTRWMQQGGAKQERTK